MFVPVHVIKRRRGSVLSRLVRFIIILVLLVAVGIGAVFFYIDSIAKTAIEKGSTYALGVPTTLKSADIKILSGEFAMNGLNVANPQGYNTSHFLTLEDGGVAVSLASLRQQTVELPQLTLTGVDMNLEKKDGKANYQIILDNLKKLESGEKAPPDPDAKKFVIKKLTINDVNVHIDTGINKLTVPIGEIVLEDVGSGDKPLKVADLTNVLIKAVLAAVASNAGDVIPGVIIGELKDGLAGLQNLDQIANVEKLGDIGKKLTEDAGKAVGEIGEKAKEGVGDLGEKAKEGLGGLLGGEKKDKP